MMKHWTDIKTKKQLRKRYASYIPALQEIAMKHGYALAVHGSMARDLDLVAVPWVKKALAPETLVMALEYSLLETTHSREFWKKDAASTTPQKLHGRKAYIILWAHLNTNFENPTHRHAYIDLSIMPRTK